MFVNLSTMTELTSSDTTNVTTTTIPALEEDVPVWQYPSYVVIVTTLVTSAVSVTGLVLNCVLVTTIKCSPSLKTPPNSHLLNICFNNLLLGVHALFSLPSLHLNGVHVARKGSEVVSGIQLFLVMHCLLQYWGAFVSIGYYRFKTIHHPSLSLRVRKLNVSRSITTTWVISLLLALTFSLTSAQGSAYLPCTLDPFRKNFYSGVWAETESEAGDKKVKNCYENSEQVVVLSLVMAILLVGLLIIVVSYYSICRTLNVAGRVGKSRISPWPRKSTSSLTPPCSEVIVGPASTVMEIADSGIVASQSLSTGGRAYRPNPDSQLFCVSGPQAQEREGTWIVHYQKHDHNIFMQDFLAQDKPASQQNVQQSRAASVKRDMFANKRPLTATLSAGSTASSGRTSSTKCPDFSDISLGADIARRYKQQNRSALKKQSVRRERGSLSKASKNSLVMLMAYLFFSLPLIVCQVPGTLDHLTPDKRVQILLGCHLLFLFNSPIYPLWYLLFSVRVKKCLKRMCETFPVRFHYQQR